MKTLLSCLALAAQLLPRPAAAQMLANNGLLQVQPGTRLYVAGSVLNTAGGTLANDGTVETTGDLTSTGGLGGSGQLRFSGSQDQTLTAPAGTTLASVTVDNAGAAGSNRLLVPQSLTIGSALTLVAGLVRTAASATISLPDGAVLAGEAPGRYVQGHLKITRNAVPGLVDFGHGVRLDGTGQALGAVSVTRSAGLLAAGQSHGTNLGGTTKGIDRIWTVVPTNPPSSPVPVSLSWLPDDDNGLAGFAQARLWQAATNAGPWVSASAGTNAAGRALTQSVASLGTFTISNAANPLPVELTSFDAQALNADAQLTWTTASEKNNDRFEVEASADGRAFRRIGTVAGQGSPAQPRTYRLLDENIARYAAQLVYYRLRQVDADGAAHLSPVRTVQVAATAPLHAAAWPNPFAGAGTSLTVHPAAAGAAELTLHDAQGRVVLSRRQDLAAGSSTLALPELGRLPSGVYVLTVQQSGGVVRLKVVRE
ncbi:T9SS type A sorting domain-containing protein [Hymenobacter ruricola]|uniref:T9SS type A sorting domain-containing protein n=1 Tax=Hymenobacter ruricola TaxID=2791023 RepID=A0ABS0I476_9BACT|nr:T9SS type A sorting domain-containing protein [Hymenobacter ruricola]MBF9221705.1 T9SS type A sorting domain-containing protein [Hymenobacter ruricola]